MAIGMTRMTKKDIIELLRLKGWNQAELARRLQLSNAAVSRWFNEERNPTGPARILMRQWLNEAKAQPAEATV
jgi:transcriptional regulator with XRE-family HTH domain